VAPEFDSLLGQCVTCASSNIKYLLTDFQGINIYQCKHCRVHFMNPQYTDKYLAALYNTYQQSDFQHHRYGSNTNPRYAKHSDNFELIGKNSKKGKLLSVGSGNGIDLLVAKRLGWQADGYEVDSAFSQMLSEKTDTTIFTGDFQQLVFDKPYDCIYLNHVIEHPKNPRAYLIKINRSLRDNGLLYLATPNIESMSIKVKRLLETLRLRRKKGSYYDTWQHLTYFNPKQLCQLLEQHFGFRVIHLSTDNKKIKDGKVIHSAFDRFTFKSSFRILAKKVRQI